MPLTPAIAAWIALVAPAVAADEGLSPTQRAARGRDPLDRCAALPVDLQGAPYAPLDLDADGWVDRLMELPGSCATRACTWRVVRRCPGGGHRTLIELIALSVTPLEGQSEAGWTDLLATVPAPSNEPQAWILRYDGAHYVRHAPAAPTTPGR